MSKWIEPAKKTPGEEFRDNIIFTIVGYFIIYLVASIMDFILNPFGKDVDKKILDKITKKQTARMDRNVSDNPDDPMNQYYQRFIGRPKDFRRDPDNEMYKNWFNEWRSGNILDSDLRWAPSCDYEITPTFLKYLKRQLNLHKGASLMRRLLFINTIHRFYPEFTPSLNQLSRDIAKYEAQMNLDDVRSNLKSEIEKYGLDETLADYLINKDFSTTKLKKTAQFLKQCMEYGYDANTSICLVENNIPLTSDVAKIIHKTVSELELPARVGLAYAQRKITIENIQEMKENLQAALEIYGLKLYQCANGHEHTVYDDLVDEYLRQYTQKKRVTAINARGKAI